MASQSQATNITITMGTIAEVRRLCPHLSLDTIVSVIDALQRAQRTATAELVPAHAQDHRHHVPISTL